MVEKQLTEGSAQAENDTIKKQRNTKIFQTLTLIFLLFVWIGYFNSLYRGNESNMSWYSLLIITLSFSNQDVLFKGEKIQNKALNILAKLESILLVVWGVVTVVSLILK